MGTTPVSTETVAMKMGASSEIAQALENACIKFGIITAVQKSHFLGQISVESGGFKTFRESLNYSVDGLMKTFGRHRISAADCQKYGRKAGQSANQEGIANAVYGGKWGADNLGNTEAGDGWRFIGRGLKQLTGRENYTKYSQAMYGDDRIIRNTALLERIPDVALSAGWYWQSRGLNKFADANDYETVTRRVNGGMNGYNDRVTATKRALQLFEAR